MEYSILFTELLQTGGASLSKRKSHYETLAGFMGDLVCFTYGSVGKDCEVFGGGQCIHRPWIGANERQARGKEFHSAVVGSNKCEN